MHAIERLRAYQQARNLTQQGLAKELGVTPAQVSTWLSGLRGPSLTTAFQVEERTGGKVPAAAWRTHDANVRLRGSRRNARKSAPLRRRPSAEA